MYNNLRMVPRCSPPTPRWSRRLGKGEDGDGNDGGDGSDDDDGNRDGRDDDDGDCDGNKKSW